MPTRGHRWLFVTALAALLLASPAGQDGRAAKASDVKAFVGARVIDGTGKPPIDRATVLVRNGRIEAIRPSSSVKVPSDADEIDVAGKTIVPGFINTHGHVGETQGLQSGAQFYSAQNVLSQLALYARYGVTTVISLGGDREAAFRIRDEQETSALQRARLYVAGSVIAATTPEDARRMVDEVAATRPNIIKIRVDDNLGTTEKMPPAVYEAVIDQAHRHGLRVAAHLFYLDDAKGLLKAGVDFLAHSVRDRDVDAELIAMLKQRDICLCPTLMREVSTFVYETTPEFFGDPFFLRGASRDVMEQLQDPKRQEGVRNSRSAQQYKVALAVAGRNLKKLAESGVRIAFGTDTGPPARFQGYFEHLELEQMVKAGLSPMQALVAATGDAARCMQLTGKVGALQPGAWADFIVLGANPLDDIRNSRMIESVWIAGNNPG